VLINPVCFVVMAAVYALLTDAFLQMRQAEDARKHDESTVCFVSGGDVRRSNRVYNKWDYVDYWLHVRLKDATELNGLEAMVLSGRGLQWVPAKSVEK
jgi:hypothetical protein